LHQRSPVVKGKRNKAGKAADSSSWYDRAKSGGKKTALILLRPSPGPLPENGVLCLTLNLTVTSGRTLRCIKGRRFFSGRERAVKTKFFKVRRMQSRAKESKSFYSINYLFIRLKIDYRENERVFIFFSITLKPFCSAKAENIILWFFTVTISCCFLSFYNFLDLCTN
jgi:hypothetical protein